MNAARIVGAILKGIGYLGFFVLCTVFFTWWTFPTDAARQFAEAQASDFAGAPVGIGELELVGLSGVERDEAGVWLVGEDHDGVQRVGRRQVGGVGGGTGDLAVGVVAALSHADATADPLLPGPGVAGGHRSCSAAV